MSRVSGSGRGGRTGVYEWEDGIVGGKPSVLTGWVSEDPRTTTSPVTGRVVVLSRVLQDPKTGVSSVVSDFGPCAESWELGYTNKGRGGRRPRPTVDGGVMWKYAGAGDKFVVTRGVGHLFPCSPGCPLSWWETRTPSPLVRVLGCTLPGSRSSGLFPPRVPS